MVRAVSAEILVFRQRPVKGTQPAISTKAIGPRHFCLKCDSDHFMIMADKSVQCAVCKSHIHNLWMS